MIKRCSKCFEYKEIINFGECKKNGKTYCNSWCKECKNDYERERRYKKSDEIALKAKIRYEKNKELIKKKRKDRRYKICEYEKKYYKKNKKKLRAQWKLRWEIRKGNMERQPCIICSQENAQAHHYDYSKPLDVIWLCAKHHKLEHTRGGQLNAGYRNR